MLARGAHFANTSARLGNLRPGSGERPARAPCPTRRSRRSVLVVQSSRLYPFHGRPSEKSPSATGRAYRPLRSYSRDSRGATRREKIAERAAIARTWFWDASHLVKSRGGESDRDGFLPRTGCKTDKVESARKQCQPEWSRGANRNKLQKGAFFPSLAPSPVSSYASVCVISCVLVIERINIRSCGGPAGSCEAPFPTMVIELSPMKRTVVTGDRIRRECRVLWLLSPRIFCTVRARFLFFFSFSPRLHVRVDCEAIDRPETFATDLRFARTFIIHGRYSTK